MEVLQTVPKFNPHLISGTPIILTRKEGDKVRDRAGFVIGYTPEVLTVLVYDHNKVDFSTKLNLRAIDYMHNEYHIKVLPIE